VPLQQHDDDEPKSSKQMCEKATFVKNPCNINDYVKKQQSPEKFCRCQSQSPASRAECVEPIADCGG
jgi:hypothetical protein